MKKKWKPFNMGVLDDGVEAAYELASKANDAASKRSGGNLVATISRSKYYGAASDGTKNDVTYQSKHEVLANCYGLVLVYGNYYQDDRTTDLSPITINVSVFYNGVNYPVYFDNGNTKKTLALGATVRTDPLDISIKKGDMLWVRTHVLQEAGQKHPRNLLLISTANNEGHTIGDTTSTATAVTPVAGEALGYTPMALYATPTAGEKDFKVLGIVGSSSSIGAGRPNFDFEGHPRGELGYMQIGAMRAGWGYITAGANGQKGADFAEPTKARSRIGLMKDCDLVAVQYASNDLSVDTATFETLRANLLKIHKIFWDMGIPTIQITVNPRTNSTDNWTTLTNQTPINANFAPGPNSARGKFNAWVMNNTDGIIGVDCNLGWESSPNSGLWIASPQSTTDGIHPNAYGHENAAAHAIRDYLLRF